MVRYDFSQVKRAAIQHNDKDILKLMMKRWTTTFFEQLDVFTKIVESILYIAHKKIHTNRYE